MNRTLSLVALSTLLLATAVEAHSGASQSEDSIRGSAAKARTIATSLTSAGDIVAASQGDNCGVEGYPWLNADGQPVEG